MSRDVPRVHVERAVGLLRQGQDQAAKKLLEDALAGRAEAPELSEDAPLELAIDDPTPEIPFVAVRAGQLDIETDGWVIDESTVKAITEAGYQALQSGKHDHEAEQAIREVLFDRARAGKVRRE